MVGFDEFEFRTYFRPLRQLDHHAVDDRGVSRVGGGKAAHQAINQGALIELQAEFQGKRRGSFLGQEDGGDKAFAVIGMHQFA